MADETSDGRRVSRNSSCEIGVEMDRSFAEGRRQRRLIDDEYRMLGMALSRSRQEKVWQPAIAATWLMILTGWRRGEVLGLRWSEVDLPR
jgi:integrase